MNLELINFIDVPYELQLETRNWRNAADVSKFFKLKLISEETHKKWLKSLTEKFPLSIAFIIYVNSIAVGVTYFHSIDYKNKQADWGIYIYNTNYRGQGVGHKVLNNCIEYATKELRLKNLFLDVNKFNTHAINLYKSFDFKICCNEDAEFLRYQKDLRSLEKCQ